MMKPCLTLEDFQNLEYKFHSEHLLDYSIYDDVVDSLGWSELDDDEHFNNPECTCMQAEHEFMQYLTEEYGHKKHYIPAGGWAVIP